MSLAIDKKIFTPVTYAVSLLFCAFQIYTTAGIGSVETEVMHTDDTRMNAVFVAYAAHGGIAQIAKNVYLEQINFEACNVSKLSFC